MGLVRLIAVMTPYDPAVLLLVAIMYVLEVPPTKPPQFIFSASFDVDDSTGPHLRLRNGHVAYGRPDNCEPQRHQRHFYGDSVGHTVGPLFSVYLMCGI